MSASGVTVFRSERVVTPEGTRAAAVVVRDGRIEGIHANVDVPKDAQVVDLGRDALLPGIVDSHAHINEPGRTDWEGFATATAAAAAGGITTVVDMPLNSIPATTSLAALRTKAEAASGQCAIDYGLWGGVIPGNANELQSMVDAGAPGFKCFLVHSGVDEFPAATREVLDAAMPILAKAGVPLLVHAELTDHEPPFAGDVRAYASYLASRPAAWEVDAIRMMIDLCRKHRDPVHIVHLSAADALDDIAKAKAEGLPFTVETCPHYLTFTAEEIEAGATHFKCAPPIREAANRERLWDAVKSGLIDLVVSDHSPCTPALKKLEAGDFSGAWGGIAGLQLSVSAVWTGMRAHGMSLDALVDRMAHRTAKLAGLSGRKGAIRPGLDADFVVFAPEARFKVAPEDIRHRHRLTPYAGRELEGRVMRTYLRGQRIFDATEGLTGPRIGQWLPRG
ncbi:allantoinase AllB [Corallococcus sp. M7]